MDAADLILTMTANHRHHLLSRWPKLACKTFGLAPDSMDVSDPFGVTDLEVYQLCAKQIDHFLDLWVAKLDESQLAQWTTHKENQDVYWRSVAIIAEFKSKANSSRC